MLKACLIDLDGTLVGRSKEISPRVLEAVRSARFPIGLCSSRDAQHLLRFASALGLRGMHVCDGGGRIVSSDGVTRWKRPLPAAMARDILSVLQQQGIALNAVIGGRGIPWEEGMAPLPNGEVTRISALQLSDGQLQELKKRYLMPGTLCLAKFLQRSSGRWGLDLTAASKGDAAERYCRLMGIPRKDLAAIGDSYNDVPLFAVAGTRVAMGDAPEELRALADYIVQTAEDDGVAEALSLLRDEL